MCVRFAIIQSMEIVKLQAETKDYIWGGRKLADYGFTAEGKIAEAWALSFHPDGPSKIWGTDTKLCDAATRADWGSACDGFAFFPVLVKFIDSADNLSVQVHPSDDYALQNEGQFGKTEMWYVVDCDAGAGLYVGLRRDMTREELRQAIQTNTLLDALNFIPVKKGDCYFIPAGTLHAIGKGCTIVEVQQNSNLTYRVYDYDRVGADGKKRPLHIEKAVAVADLSAYKPTPMPDGYLARCKYFCAARQGAGTVGRDTSFTAVTVTGGRGTLNGKPLVKGDTWFIPAGKRARIEGDVTAVTTWVEETE